MSTYDREPSPWDEDEPREGAPASCKRCGAKHLRWERDENDKWVLVTQRFEVHRCPPPSPSDFEDLSK